jgi:cytochrome oxidase assembly protein ShyY1
MKVEESAFISSLALILSDGRMLLIKRGVEPHKGH